MQDMKHAFVPPAPLSDELCRALYRVGFPQPHVRAAGSTRYMRGTPHQAVAYRPTLEEVLVWIEYLTEQARGPRSAVAFERTEHGTYRACTPVFQDLKGQGSTYVEAAAVLGIKIATSLRPTPRDTSNVSDIRNQRRRHT